MNRQQKKEEFKFTAAQREKLIDFVKAHEELYKIAHPLNHNRDVKDRLWIEIGGLLRKDGKH